MSNRDPVKVAPENYKVLFENDKIRVLEATLKKGEKTGMHRHPNNFVYMLNSGHAKFTSSDGQSQELHAEPGQTVWNEEQEHTSENLGNETVRGLIVELK